MIKMAHTTYEDEKSALQVELLKVQHWVQDTGQKFVLLFEGRDAAGKGGTIKRFTEHLNPRAARVVALNKPTDEERGQWFFQRYVKHLPTAGEMVLYDRSWYNRASFDKWDDYTEAKEAMFFYTDTADAPWTVIRSNDKKRARLTCMRHFLSQLDYPDKDPSVARPPDPKIYHQAEAIVHSSDHVLAASLHPQRNKT